MAEPSGDDLLARAMAEVEAGNTLSALRLSEEALARDPSLGASHTIRARCLAGMQRLDEAAAAARLAIDTEPSEQSHQILRSVEAALAAQRTQHSSPRRWASFLSPSVLRPLEEASHRYTYRGHALIKNPFEFALYPLLLWNLKPRSIFEIGSYNGASALWMADTLRTYGTPCKIVSLDVVRVTAIQDPDITFLAGSGRNPAEAFPPELLASSPKPWLVVEDADHTLETTRTVLRHFHPHMSSGDYFVVEDSATADGPRLALEEFLGEHGDAYEVDARYCDFFGYNATWCVNGYLRKK